MVVMYIINKQNLPEHDKEFYSRLEFVRDDEGRNLSSTRIYELYCQFCGKKVEEAVHIDCTIWTDFQVDICKECIKQALELIE